MTPELWERLKPLFNEAVERPLIQRRTFVAEVCKDDAELHRELIALVEAHEQQELTTQEIVVNIQDIITIKPPATLSPGVVLLGRFKIVRHLGSGGMGNVYEAFDSELSQAVALKMIRPEIAENELVLSRFKKEVQLARRLSGPNVCRIHELFANGATGQMPGGAFLTMEYLDGISLAERVRKGPVSWREAQAIAFDICAGLSVVHSAGILHRDLKSRNIMLANRNGATRAVLMDFGLARQLSPPGRQSETGITVPGAVLGTPEYMAPEQFEGKAATPATDIYSVGIVLYELVTGKHPFASSNILGAAVLRGKRPDPASSVNHSVPHRWDNVIGKCLEYAPSRRYQSANDLAGALRSSVFRLNGPKLSRSALLILALTLGLVLPCVLFIPTAREALEGFILSNHEKHVAVLPFSVPDDNQETVLIGDGLMDSLTGKLSNLNSANQALWVVPASEVRRRHINDPPSALREFGANIVIKGHFSRENHTDRLDLEVIDTRKMREIGYANVENREENLAALQAESLKRLGRLMKLSIVEDAVLGGEEGVAAQAYEDYIAALGYLQRYDKPGNLDSAVDSLTKAIAISPGFTLAMGKLGQAYILKFHVDANPDFLKKAREYCTRAIALDNRIPALYVALAELDEISGQLELASHEFQHVIDIDPRNSEALIGMAALYKKAGRNTDAERMYIRAAELWPDDWNGYNYLGNFYEGLGRHKEAIAQYKHAIGLTPDNAFVYSNLGGAYLNSGDPALLAEAEKAFIKSISLNPSYQAYAGLGDLYGTEKRFADSANATEKALQIDDQDYQVWNNLSQAYEGLGEQGKASVSRKRAISLAERAVTLNPQDADAHATLATLYGKEGLQVIALSNIHTALALAPSDQNTLSEIAAAYEILGDRKHAIKYLNLAIRNGFSPLQVNADLTLQRIASDPDSRIQRR
jgi:serine/threonine protein kinase/Flp pilus assembly protein TadD